MTLSTAQPQLNATPPELLALDITVVGRGAMAANAAGTGQDRAAGASGQAVMGGARSGRNMGGMMGGHGRLRPGEFRDQSRELRQKAQTGDDRQPRRGRQGVHQRGRRPGAGRGTARPARMTRQRMDDAKEPDATAAATVDARGAERHLPPPFAAHRSLAQRPATDRGRPHRDQARLLLQGRARADARTSTGWPTWSTRATTCCLPGEATMYVGSDFVGRMNLPLVAIGERYTVGFGVDPQLQVSRTLVEEVADRAGGQPGPQLRVPDHGRQLQVGGGEGAGLGSPAPGRGRGGRRQPGRAGTRS